MKERISPLRNLHVASPCTADWDAMRGDDRARHCAECSLTVYNISAMTRVEAERLILERQGRLCIRMYQRADGTVITKDCPTGLRAARKLMWSRLQAAGAAVVAMTAGLLNMGASSTGASPKRSTTVTPGIEISLEPIRVVPDDDETSLVFGPTFLHEFPTVPAIAVEMELAGEDNDSVPDPLQAGFDPVENEMDHRADTNDTVSTERPLPLRAAPVID